MTAFALFAHGDDLLFWFVGDGAPEFCYAKMLIGTESNGTFTGSEYAFHLGYDWEDEYIYDERPAWDPSVQAAMVGEGYEGLSFIVELYNDGDELTHQSNIYHLKDLSEYIVRQHEFSAAWRNIEPLQVWPFTPVPEPTSGMLILVGAALLALRRGRVGG